METPLAASPFYNKGLTNALPQQTVSFRAAIKIARFKSHAAFAANERNGERGRRREGCGRAALLGISYCSCFRTSYFTGKMVYKTEEREGGGGRGGCHRSRLPPFASSWCFLNCNKSQSALTLKEATFLATRATATSQVCIIVCDLLGSK